MATKEVQRKLFGQILKEKKLINEEQLQEALEMQKVNGKALGDVLVDLDYITQDVIMGSLGEYLGLEVVNIKDIEIDEELLSRIPHSVAQLYRVLPLKYYDSTLTLAIAQECALDMEQVDDLRFLLHYNIKPVLVDKEDVVNALAKYYPSTQISVGDLMDKFDENMSDIDVSGNREVIEVEQLKELADEAPVKTFVNLVLLQAIVDKASDIHFEAFENKCRVRYRIDGLLVEKMPVPQQFSDGIVSRVKVMANMDIAERRLPQDGRISVTIRGHAVDIRVSTLPTKFGESIVMRILDKGATSLDLTSLGLMPDDNKLINQFIKRPNGIILVTGPTGSGKTTTLYACLNDLNGPGEKIITTEDPVEYDIDGLMQIQVNPEIGVTFASCLRAILRQDPDIILVGEIRDIETLEIAIQASLTGHLVFSTLHTNDAPSTISRLLNMGIKPYLITASLIAVVAQRLVRRICENCKEEYTPGEDSIRELKLSKFELEGKRFYTGRGCGKCNRTGYKGRLAILEIMAMSDDICTHVIKQSSIETIREVATNNGMRTLMRSGFDAACRGVTTIEEIVRETNMN